MPAMKLEGCTAMPFGAYLKGLGVLRLVVEQADGGARGWWDGDTFALDSKLDREELLDFFLSMRNESAMLPHRPSSVPDHTHMVSQTTCRLCRSFLDAQCVRGPSGTGFTPVVCIAFSLYFSPAS